MRKQVKPMRRQLELPSISKPVEPKPVSTYDLIEDLVDDLERYMPRVCDPPESLQRARAYLLNHLREPSNRQITQLAWRFWAGPGLPTHINEFTREVLKLWGGGK